MEHSEEDEIKKMENNDDKQSSTSYQEWIQQAQVSRNANWKLNVAIHESEDTEKPPKFDGVTLFHNGIEEYAISNTTLVSKDVQSIATETGTQDLFAPCMVGSLESQFLKLQVQVSGAKKVLDIGTFTGMSALALAEGLPQDGKVVTLENDPDIARVAQQAFDSATFGHKIHLILGNAVQEMKNMSAANTEKFDIIFIDADKETYIEYYELSLGGLLAEDGILLVDNSLCALLYDKTDERTQKLHEFNQHAKKDPRVEQVVM